MILFKNPFTYYVHFLVNYLLNKRKFKYFYQGYNSIVINCEIEKRVKIYDNVILSTSKIGSYTYIHNNTQITNCNIGKFCSIGHNCRFGLGKHPSSLYVSTHPVFFSTNAQVGITFVKQNYFEEFEKIIIGNDVWIGDNVIILDGVKIEDGAIIGAGAVVTKNVPPYAICGGVPAKIIRYRFLPEEIEFLLEIKWWNKHESWLKKHYKIFHDINHFKKYIKKNPIWDHGDT